MPQLMSQYIRVLLASATLLCTLLLPGLAVAQGTLETIQVHGPALEGNLAGDDPEREVFVYLPPGYAEDTGTRYPVVYFLHGYGATAQIYVEGVLDLPASADAAITAGAQPAIIVVPNAYNTYSGSMYANSPTVGDWESYIADDLVTYIDSNYRTLAAPGSRGLSGHSMGGYGTLRIGMKRPGVFAALYAMSACCLLNQAPDAAAVAEQVERMAEGSVAEAGGFANVLQAQASAWAPNPQNPPYYSDWPYDDEGEALPLVQGKWIANSPLVTVDQYVPVLQGYRAIALDVGDKDSLVDSNSRLSAALERLGVAHGYEIYDGDHGNRVGQRFREEVLPFFTQHLDTVE